MIDKGKNNEDEKKGNHVEKTLSRLKEKNEEMMNKQKIQRISLIEPKKKAIKKANSVGLEFDPDVKNDKDYCQKIYKNQMYFHDDGSVVQSDLDVIKFLEISDLKDTNNLGLILGMSIIGVIGFSSFSFSKEGGLGGSSVGIALGKYAGRKITWKIKKKKPFTECDFLILRLQCFLKYLEITKRQNKNDLNSYRIILEKAIRGFKLSLYYSLFTIPSYKKSVYKNLRKFRSQIMTIVSQKALLLSYKLFKIFLKNVVIKDHEERIAFQLHNVFLPVYEILNLNQKDKKIKKLLLYYKLEKLLRRNDLRTIMLNHPDFERTDDYTKHYIEGLQHNVNLTDLMAEYFATRPDIAKALGLNQIEKSNHDPIKSRLSSIDLDMKLIKGMNNTKNRDKILSDEELEAVISPKKLRDENKVLGESQKILTKKSNSDNLLPILEEKENDGGIKKAIPKENNDNLKKMDRGTMSEIRIKNKFIADDLDKSVRCMKYIEKKEFSSMSLVVNSDDEKDGKFSFEEEQEHEIYSHPDLVRLDKDSKAPKKRNSQIFIGTEILNSGASASPSKFSTEKKADIDLNKFPETQPFEQYQPPDIDLTKVQPVSEENVIKNDPILEANFKKINEIIIEDVSTWTTVFKKNNLQIYRKLVPTGNKNKKLPGNPCVIIKAFSILEDVSVQNVFDAIYKIEIRKRWDTVFAEFLQIDKIDDLTDVIYFYIKPPIGVTVRDFLQRRSYKWGWPEKNSVIIQFKSIEHPAVPVFKANIRAETIISGYIIKPDPVNPRNTHLALLTQVDVKGAIPKYIVNYTASKAPIDWVNNLLKGCSIAKQQQQQPLQQH